MTKGVKLFWGTVILVIIFIIVTLTRAPRVGEREGALPDGPIKIGAILPLTGDAAAYGMPIQRAGIIATEEINAAGGIAGRQIELIWEDGKCDDKAAAAAAQKLINIDKVKIIFGGGCSPETLAIAPLAQIAKVIVISPSEISPEITGAGDFIFRTAPSDAAAGAVAANYAYSKLGARKAAIISETKDYAQGLRKVFSQRFGEAGGEIVADETYNTGDTDMRAQILKIKNAAPDLVYILPQTTVSGMLIIKQLAVSGVAAQRLTAEVMIGRDIVEENKADMEGVVGIEPWFDAENELASALLAKYEERWGETAPLPAFMANIYSQFYLIKEAIDQVGLDSDKLRQYLYGLSGWTHALGKLTFDQNGDPVGLPYSVKKVTNGELAEAEVFTPEAR